MDDALQVLLPHLPRERIADIYRAASGNEVSSGKFSSPESSAALVANSFGLFLDRPGSLPLLPGVDSEAWPIVELRLEAIVRFPWSGGRHPCLDVLLRSDTALIGIESKRYEPYRSKSKKNESKAYDRDVWGDRMSGYRNIWGSVSSNAQSFKHLDVAQLVKHALAIRTQIHRSVDANRKGVLYYLYAEPRSWPDGTIIEKSLIEDHRREVTLLAGAAAKDEVCFVARTYEDVLASWRSSGERLLINHADAVSRWARLDS